MIGMPSTGSRYSGKINLKVCRLFTCRMLYIHTCVHMYTVCIHMYHTYQSLHVRSYTYDAYIYQKDAKAFVSVFLMGEGSLYRPVVGIATFRIFVWSLA